MWSFEEVVVDVLLESSMLQNFKKKSLSYVLDRLLEICQGVLRNFEDKDFHYVEKGNTIYLIFKILFFSA